MKRVLFIIFVTFFLFVNLVEGSPYVNNMRYFYALDEDFNYQDINSMTSREFEFYYFQGGILDSTLLYGVRRSIDKSYEAYVRFPFQECYSSVIYEFKGKYNGVGNENIRWIILLIKEQGYKFNYGTGYAITFYHSPKNVLTIFKADGGLSSVWSVSAPQLSNNVWHTYKVVFDDYTISVYIDDQFVGSYTDTSRSYPLCGGVALMYEQTEGEMYIDWLKVKPFVNVETQLPISVLSVEKRGVK